MIPDDLTLAHLAASAYTDKPTLQIRDMFCVVTPFDGGNVAAIRGTVLSDLANILTDADALIPFDIPRLGLCHRGFGEDCYAMFTALYNMTKDLPLVITGHSMGAAEALILAATFIAHNAGHLFKVTTFGCPAPAYDLAAIIGDLPGTDYRNSDDPVTELPPWPYRHPRPLRQIGTPTGIPCLDDHFIASYEASLCAQN